MIIRAESSAQFSNALNEALLSFRCELDKDIETFLHKKAISFYKKSLCSVFLLLDEDSFNQGKIRINAYFTLSYKSIIADRVHVSNKHRSIITGGFRKAPVLDFILIGHLGKHIEKMDDGTLNCAPITGEEILDIAFETMQQANLLVPMRCALVECSDNPKVMKVYEDYHFEFFQRDDKHNQYYKII